MAGEPDTSGETGKGYLKRLHALSEEQAERISELEIRLSLLESEAREVRIMLEDADGRRRKHTIRIGASNRKQTTDDTTSEGTTIAESGERRPVLRLYGTPAAPKRSEPLVLPPLPPGVPERLPVAPLSGRESARGSFGKAVSAGSQGDVGALTEYREALGLVRQRKFDGALQALTAFLEKHPNHPYTDNAIYWKGEVYYAKRDYRHALKQFEEVATRFPSSRKMPDSLLKIGMCHSRLGDRGSALDYFRRVVRRYPDSNAARIASREGAT